MTPREALVVAVRAGWQAATRAGRDYQLVWGTDDGLECLALVPEEARRVLLTDWQEEARLYAQNADYWRKRCEEAYAEAARIARELATHPAELMSRHEIADAIEARAREKP